MTQNAVAYFGQREAERSNRASELETARSHRENEANALRNYEEAVKHNRQLEALESKRLSEQARHNSVLEAQGWNELAIKRRQQQIAQQQVHLGYADLDRAYAQLSELSRSNRASEAELYRSHVAQEAELRRHNKVSEMTGIGTAITSSIANLSQAKTAARNAAVNRMNAYTNKYSAQTQRKNVQNQYKLGVWGNINQSVKTGFDTMNGFFGNVSKFVDALIPF